MYRLPVTDEETRCPSDGTLRNGDILDVRREETGSRHPADISLHPMSRPNEVEHEAVSRMIDMARLLHGSGLHSPHPAPDRRLKR